MPSAIDITNTDTKAVAATAAQFDLTLEAGKVYRLVSTTDCWIAQGANPTAAPNVDANVFLGAKESVFVDGTLGAKLSIIRNAADGFACLSHFRVL